VKFWKREALDMNQQVRSWRDLEPDIFLKIYVVLLHFKCKYLPFYNNV